MFHDEKLMNHKRIRGLWREANGFADDEETLPMSSICNTLQHLIARQYVNPTSCLSLRTSSMLLNGAAQAYKKKVAELFAETEQLDKEVRKRNCLRDPDSSPSSGTDAELKSNTSYRNANNSPETTGQEPETMMRMDRERPDFDGSPILPTLKRKSSAAPIIYASLKKPCLQRLSLTPRYGSSSSEHLRSPSSQTSESLKPRSLRSEVTDPELSQTFTPEHNSVPGLSDSPKPSVVPDLQSDPEVTSASEEEVASEGIQTNTSSNQKISQTTPLRSEPPTPSEVKSGPLSTPSSEFINLQITPPREHSSTEITPPREHFSTEITPSREQIGTNYPFREQITTRKHMGTQTTPSMGDIGTQTTPSMGDIGTQTTPSTRQQGTQTGLLACSDVPLPYAQVFVFAASRVDSCLMIEGQLSTCSDEDEGFH